MSNRKIGDSPVFTPIKNPKLVFINNGALSGDFKRIESDRIFITYFLQAFSQK